MIANNLRVRRAIESFPNITLDFAGICRFLQVSLECAGFCGIAMSFPGIDMIDDTLLFPLQSDGGERWSHCWEGRDRPSSQWELKLELVSSSGRKVADLYLFRERASDALLVDMTLLGDEFRGAISDMVDGALAQIPAHAEVMEKSTSLVSVRAAGTS